MEKKIFLILENKDMRLELMNDGTWIFSKLRIINQKLVVKYKNKNIIFFVDGTILDISSLELITCNPYQKYTLVNMIKNYF